MDSDIQQSIEWTFNDALGELKAHVPEGSLILTNCHPHQLPCPDTPRSCQLHPTTRKNTDENSDSLEWWHNIGKWWHKIGEWVVLGILFLIILISALCIVKCRQSKKKEIPAVDSMLDNIPQPRNNKHRTLYLTRSQVCDDFYSEGAYEQPLQMHATGNKYKFGSPSKTGRQK